MEEKGKDTHIADLDGKYFRTLPIVPILIGMFDGEGGVCFPDRSGKVDFSEMLTGVSEEFNSWISEVFQYYWNMTVYLSEDP